MDKQTYLFNCFWSQDNGMVITNTHAVFDSDANASELCRPSIAIRNVDTAVVDVSIRPMAGRGRVSLRFNSDALACFEGIAPRISRAVVDIQSNIMSNVVWEQNVHSLMDFNG